jgi:hypothetical protein
MENITVRPGDKAVFNCKVRDNTQCKVKIKCKIRLHAWRGGEGKMQGEGITSN